MAGMTGDARFFQEALLYNHCFGCGQDNEHGLQILSRWDDEDPELSICDFEPLPRHSAYPIDVVYGGIIAGVVDCHSICTSIADAYRRAGRAIGNGDVIMYATASLHVNYQKPTPISSPFRLVSRVVEATEKRTRIESTVFDESGTQTANGEVSAVLVPSAWANPAGLFATG